MKAFHYSAVKFEIFDMSKCDGIWLTTVSPSDHEMLDEIGASGSNWCAVCEIEFENSLLNGDNYDVESQLSDEFDCLENSYDGFTDYAFSDASKVKIIEWVEV